MLAAVERAYSTPVRAYHHWGHVREVLRHFEAVAQGPGWTWPAEAGLAVLYHDAIYVPGRSDNETASAALAAEHVSQWLPDDGTRIALVVELIELTARHGQHAPADFAGRPEADDIRHFLDCDMAILGAAPRDFDAYDRAIAEEYAPVVPGWLFRLRRRRFLRSLLRRDRIYLSDFFHERLERRARENLLRRLAKGTG